VHRLFSFLGANMASWFVIEGGEEIKAGTAVGVGAVKKVKVSSGKGLELVERTVFNFTIRIGTGGVIVKSPDYSSEEIAKEFREQLKRG